MPTTNFAFMKRMLSQAEGLVNFASVRFGPERRSDAPPVMISRHRGQLQVARFVSAENLQDLHRRRGGEEGLAFLRGADEPGHLAEQREMQLGPVDRGHNQEQ